MHGRWRAGRSFDLERMKEMHLAHRFHDGRGSCGAASFAADRLFGARHAEARERRRGPHVFDLGRGPAEAARFPWMARPTGAPPRGRPSRLGERA